MCLCVSEFEEVLCHPALKWCVKNREGQERPNRLRGTVCECTHLIHAHSHTYLTFTVRTVTRVLEQMFQEYFFSNFCLIFRKDLVFSLKIVLYFKCWIWSNSVKTVKE